MSGDGLGGSSRMVESSEQYPVVASAGGNQLCICSLSMIAFAIQLASCRAASQFQHLFPLKPVLGFRVDRFFPSFFTMTSNKQPGPLKQASRTTA